MHRGVVAGREVLPDKSLGKPVVVDGASCPHDSTHDVVVDGRYLGSYCEQHDHPSRSVRVPKKKRRVSVWIYDVHTGDRVGYATERFTKNRKIGVPFTVIDAGVKKELVLRACETDDRGMPVR